MFEKVLSRYYTVIASVYLYNEFRGYTELERLLAAVRQKFPQEMEFISAVEKHTADERKHYRMFRRYFESRGEMPLVITHSSGYVDKFVRLLFRRKLEDLNTAEILQDDKEFFKLCRLVMMTEFRGMKQVDALLNSSLMRRNDDLMRILHIVERDEPTHCYPYQQWLRIRKSHESGWRERMTDLWVHYSLLLIKFPLLYLNLFHPRLDRFPA
jgi:hypothetical protein